MSQEWKWESSLAGRFGVSREEVRRARKRALSDEDWGVDRKRVVVSPEGVKKLAEELQVMRSEKNEEASNFASAGAGGVETGAGAAEEQGEGIASQNDGSPEVEQALGPAEAEVEYFELHKLVVNPRMILARSKATGQVVRIKVKDAGKFCRGMEIPARQIQGDLYELARPEPRWRGRW